MPLCSNLVDSDTPVLLSFSSATPTPFIELPSEFKHSCSLICTERRDKKLPQNGYVLLPLAAGGVGLARTGSTLNLVSAVVLFNSADWKNPYSPASCIVHTYIDRIYDDELRPTATAQTRLSQASYTATTAALFWQDTCPPHFPQNSPLQPPPWLKQSSCRIHHLQRYYPHQKASSGRLTT